MFLQSILDFLSNESANLPVNDVTSSDGLNLNSFLFFVLGLTRGDFMVGLSNGIRFRVGLLTALKLKGLTALDERY